MRLRELYTAVKVDCEQVIGQHKSACMGSGAQHHFQKASKNEDSLSPLNIDIITRVVDIGCIYYVIVRIVQRTMFSM